MLCSDLPSERRQTRLRGRGDEGESRDAADIAIERGSERLGDRSRGPARQPVSPAFSPTSSAPARESQTSRAPADYLHRLDLDRPPHSALLFPAGDPSKRTNKRLTHSLTGVLHGGLAKARLTLDKSRPCPCPCLHAPLPNEQSQCRPRSLAAPRVSRDSNCLQPRARAIGPGTESPDAAGCRLRGVRDIGQREAAAPPRPPITHLLSAIAADPSPPRPAPSDSAQRQRPATPPQRLSDAPDRPPRGQG